MPVADDDKMHRHVRFRAKSGGIEQHFEILYLGKASDEASDRRTVRDREFLAQSRRAVGSFCCLLDPERDNAKLLTPPDLESPGDLLQLLIRNDDDAVGHACEQTLDQDEDTRLRLSVIAVKNV